jgi:spore coat polysaccharide biosynthesis protein SpsF
MKIGAIILCRYNSSRLPGKILKEIGGIPILQHIINRLSQIQELDIIVATSEESTDDPISNYCAINNQPYYRGSLDNVSGRILSAAKEYDLDYFIRINGDNLFIDTAVLTEMMELATKGEYDFISNVKNRTFPYGMSIEIVNVDFYSNIIEKFITPYYKEHVTIYLYENESKFNVKYFYNHELKEASGLKLAIDTEEDFLRAEKIVCNLDSGLSSYDLKEIVEVINKINE